eukprot:Nk52_evm6s290 gene=Nk52_evmTU6s290
MSRSTKYTLLVAAIFLAVCASASRGATVTTQVIDGAYHVIADSTIHLNGTKVYAANLELPSSLTSTLDTLNKVVLTSGSTRTVGPSADFATVAEALDALSTYRLADSASFTISIAAGTFPLSKYNLNAFPYGGRVTIEGSTGGSGTILQTDDEEMIAIRSGATGLTFKNILFENTASSTSDVAVRVEGSSVALENVEFKNFALPVYSSNNAFVSMREVTMTNCQKIATARYASVITINGINAVTSSSARATYGLSASEFSNVNVNAGNTITSNIMKGYPIPFYCSRNSQMTFDKTTMEMPGSGDKPTVREGGTVAVFDVNLKPAGAEYDVAVFGKLLCLGCKTNGGTPKFKIASSEYAQCVKDNAPVKE